jgi:hypothetical protein
VFFSSLQEQFTIIFHQRYHAIQYLPSLSYCYNEYWNSFRWNFVPVSQFLFRGFNIGHLAQCVPQLRPFIYHLEHSPHNMKSCKVLKCCKGKVIIGTLFLYLCLHWKDLAFFNLEMLFKIIMLACYNWFYPNSNKGLKKNLEAIPGNHSIYSL